MNSILFVVPDIQKCVLQLACIYQHLNSTLIAFSVSLSLSIYSQYVDSFNFNPNKWMLVNFDCSVMWYVTTQSHDFKY